MLVETFECHETASEPIEAAAEAIELIERLGLDGQKQLISGEDGSNKSRCPYREMTADEKFVYRTLCPTRAKLIEYKRTPIPLRVLQVAAHAQSLGMFKELVVLDTASAVEKDPVLVGVVQDGEYSWRTTDYILARWGDELEAFVVLLKRAAVKACERWLTNLTRIQAEAETLIASLHGVSDSEVASKGENSEYSLSKP